MPAKNAGIRKDRQAKKDIYGDMIRQMSSTASTGDLIADCMNFDPNTIKRVPLRCRIIARAFVDRLSLDQLNDLLAEARCPKLYARSFTEATLIYAFKKRLSFEAWRSLVRRLDEIETGEDDRFFRGTITYGELKRYIAENSEQQGDIIATRSRTRLLREGIESMTDDDLFFAYMSDNISAFSNVREKTRYFFIKYLCYYIERHVERYLDSFSAPRRKAGRRDSADSELYLLRRILKRGDGADGSLTPDEAVSGLRMLQCRAKLSDMKKSSIEEKRKVIESSAVSCGEIFSEFNYYFDRYVSSDWEEILVECYSSIEEMPADQRRRIADILRSERSEWKKLPDAQVIRMKQREIQQEQDEMYALEGGKPKRDPGENAVRCYIKGTKDIDRTVLICFLLFFASDASMPEPQKLTQERLNEILLKCGFAALDMDNNADWFAAEFLESEDKFSLLTDLMNEYAHRNENSFLYHIYSGAVNSKEELDKVMRHTE